MKTLTYIAKKGETFKTLYEGKPYNFRKGIPVPKIPDGLALVLEGKLDADGDKLFTDKNVPVVSAPILETERSLQSGAQMRYFN
jgi:hypothetical protein